MQMLYIDQLYWKTKNLDRKLCSPVAAERVEKLKLYAMLRREGCCAATALEAINISRATCFRWKKALSLNGPKGLEPGSKKPLHARKSSWSKELQTAVYRLRKENPIPCLPICVRQISLYSLMERKGAIVVGYECIQS